MAIKKATKVKSVVTVHVNASRDRFEEMNPPQIEGGSVMARERNLIVKVVTEICVTNK